MEAQNSLGQIDIMVVSRLRHRVIQGPPKFLCVCYPLWKPRLEGSAILMHEWVNSYWL